MKIAFETLGCKLNQAETELLARQFANAGHRLVSPAENADIYILNTCTVTRTADAKSRHLLRLAHRRNPGAAIVAAGCYAQRAPEVLAKIEGVNLVADNDEKPFLYRILEESGYLSSPASAQSDPAPDYEPAFRTRSFIKIQDGCNSFCSYCIVPLVRGREKSLPADRIISEVKQRVSGGIKEVVLTGTEIGSYNYNGINLKDLFERILAETAVARLRLSSLQPAEITPGLIDLWQDGRLCPHFHLSLQSGSDNVLRRMKRRYSTADYYEAVTSIRTMVPDAAITTDVIAGFPGETGQEFEESCDFIRKTGFARLHVFSYSPRPGTEAAGMAEQVQDNVKTQRNQNLRALGRECIKSYTHQFLGRSMPVLWEQQSGDIWSGYTPNYIKVYTKSKEDLTNQLISVKLQKLYKGDGAWGEGV